MPLWHRDLSKRKITGGKKRSHRTKRVYERGGFAAETSLGDPFRVERIARGSTKKTKLLYEKYANVTDRVKNATAKVEIVRVINNPVNPDYNRRRIITKGALIETPLGEAVVTSRPGQDGLINAVLLNNND